MVDALPALVRSYSSDAGPDLDRIRQLTSACFALAASSDLQSQETLVAMHGVPGNVNAPADVITATATATH